MVDACLRPFPAQRRHANPLFASVQSSVHKMRGHAEELEGDSKDSPLTLAKADNGPPGFFGTGGERGMWLVEDPSHQRNRLTTGFESPCVLLSAQKIRVYAEELTGDSRKGVDVHTFRTINEDRLLSSDRPTRRSRQSIRIFLEPADM